jgi:protein SCO1/2
MVLLFLRLQKNIDVSRKALLALCVIILIPLVFFTITDYESRGAVAMPRRYYYDTVTQQVRDGKTFYDTVWHRVQNVQLTNQLGNSVTLDDIQGKVIVADFFFTHCPSICPTLTRNLKKLQDALKLKDDMHRVDTSFVQFLSFSIDPIRDSVPVLKKYADKYGVNPDVWWLLTGPKKTIYDFSLDQMKLAAEDGESVDSNFIHTGKMVLLDRDHVIRGYYNGLDSVEMSKLASDIVFIMLEKDKRKPSALNELKPLIPLLALVIVGTFIATYIISRKQKVPGSSGTKRF